MVHTSISIASTILLLLAWMEPFCGGLHLNPPFVVPQRKAGESFNVACRYPCDSGPNCNGEGFEWLPEWLDGHESVSFEVRDYYGGYESVLSIDSLTGVHNTTYICRYRNEDGWDTVTFDLHVLEEPSFKNCPEEQNIVLGQASSMVLCQADLGEPPAQVIWTRDGNVITDPRFIPVNGQGLNISQVMQDDGGKYTCVLQTAHHSPFQNINIAVVDQPGCDDPPQISQIQSPVTINFNMSLELNCSLQSGKALVNWSLPNGDITPGHLLNIPPPVLSGTYLCIARGIDNCDVHLDTASVKVIVNAPPMPETKSTNITAKVGQDVRLPCSIAADPPATPLPTYTWRKKGNWNSYPNGGMERIHVDTQTKELVISYTLEEDFTQYDCVVENLIGTSQQTVELVYSEGNIQREYIGLTVQTRSCDDDEKDTSLANEVTDDVLDLLMNYCHIEDCKISINEPKLTCCNYTSGYFTASITALDAQTLVGRLNRTEFHDTQTKFGVCTDRDQCQCEVIHSDPSTSGQATVPGAIAGVFAGALVIVVAVVLLIGYMKFRSRKKRQVSVESRSSSSLGQVEAQTEGGHQTSQQKLEQSFRASTPQLPTTGNPASNTGSTNYAVEQNHLQVNPNTACYSHHGLPTVPCNYTISCPEHSCTSLHHPSTSLHHPCSCNSSPCHVHHLHQHNTCQCSPCHTPHMSPIPSHTPTASRSSAYNAAGTEHLHEQFEQYDEQTS